MKVPDRVQSGWSFLNKFTPELWEWAVLAVVLVYAVLLKYPQQVPVILFKAAQFCGAVYVAHLIDLRFFSVKDDEPRDVVRAAKELARAIVFLGTVVGLTLGI